MRSWKSSAPDKARAWLNTSEFLSSISGPFIAVAAATPKRILLATTALTLASPLVPASAQQISTSGDVVPTYPGGNPWNVGGNLTVGNTSNGSLTVQNGGSVTVPGDTYLGGNAASATGQVTISNGSLTTGRLFLGWANGSQGNVLITNGSTVNITSAVPNTLGIAQGAGATGTLTISNNSTLNLAGSMGMGQDGNGTLNVLSGSKVNINGPGGGLFIGNVAGVTGTVLVDGTGSTINSTAEVFTSVGTGNVTVQNGGLIHADGSIHAGAFTNAGTGTFTVTGAGSAMTAGQDVRIGEFGHGTLNVLNQGTVTAGGTFSIGDQSTGVGTALVNGAGSRVTAASLNVGNAGTGTLTLANQGVVNATGGTTIAAQAGSTGTLNIGAAAGSAAAAPGTLNTPSVAFGSGTGRIVFNHTSNSYTFAPAISGTGAVDAYSGTTVMTGASTYAGPTTVHAGTLAAGAANVFSPNSGYVVQSGATLDLRGSNQTVGSLNNAGLVNLGVAGGAPGTTLKVNGNYVGVGGTLAMNTLLNAGGPLSNQFTDRLLVHGNADNTTVQIRPSGGGAYTSVNTPTASSGISIIQVAGTSSVNAFTLAGGTVVGGPYQYRLNAYGPGSPYGPAAASQNLVGNASGYWDYRLQNLFVTPSGPVDPGQPLDPTNTRPALAPQVPAYISAPTALFSAGLQDIDELHRRLGEIRDAQVKGLPQTAEFFARGYGNMMTYKSTRSFANYGIDASESYAAFQLGGSAVVTSDDLGMLRLGLAGSYGKLQFDPNAPDGFSEGNINVGKVSGIATFQALAGWYLDGIVSGGWFNGTVNTAARGQAATLNGSMIGASLEGGYPIGLGWQKLSVEPQVQVSWQHLMFDGTTDADSINVKLGALDQGVVRAGARLVRPFETDDGRFVTPYAKVNLLQGFADNNNSISVGGVNFNTGQYGTAIQMGGGVTGMLTASLAVYGDVSYQHEVSNGGFRGWAFNGGVRYSF